MTWTWRTTVNTTYWQKREPAFLLQETFDFLLLETGDKIKLENPFDISLTDWTWRTLIT